MRAQLGDRHGIANACLREEGPIYATGFRIEAVNVSRVGADEYATGDDAWLPIGRGATGETKGPLQLQVPDGVRGQARLPGILETSIGNIRTPAIPLRTLRRVTERWIRPATIGHLRGVT
jgi:hypothetical protein